MLGCPSQTSRPEPAEDTTFSAFGEDAILQKYISDYPDIPHSYVDIGAGDGISMSNTYRLALQQWDGLCLELDGERFADLAERYAELPRVMLNRTRVSPRNICATLTAHNIPHNFGILSLDIDSYDHDVLASLLEKFSPRVIVAEINEKVPPPIFFTARYDAAHEFDGVCYGQSLTALTELSAKYGYRLRQCEYNNAFLLHERISLQPAAQADLAYGAGYRDRADRATLFPYNNRVDALLDLAPEEGAETFEGFIADRHKGHYSLHVPTAPSPLSDGEIT
jgi:hypothetical protein